MFKKAIRYMYENEELTTSCVVCGKDGSGPSTSFSTDDVVQGNPVNVEHVQSLLVGLNRIKVSF